MYYVTHIFRNCSDVCVGSKTLCDYMKDENNTFLDLEIKRTIWAPTPKTQKFGAEFTSFKRLKSMMKHMIIVKLQYSAPQVEMTVLDARSSLSDKIAKLGGTFGIWVQLTGCTLLVLINLIVVMFKLGFKVCK